MAGNARSVWVFWMRRAALAFCVILPVFVAPSPAAAGGWTQPEGEFYLKIWDRSLIGHNAFDEDGNVADIGSFQDHQLNAYFEYGLVDRWTWVAFASPIGFASGDLDSTAYVGPIVSGLRHGLIQGDWNLALEAHYGFEPGLGDTVIASGPYTDDGGDAETAVYVPAINNHHGELQLQLGHGLSWGWFTINAGMRLNSEAAIDPALLALTQLGWNIGDTWTLDAQLSLHQPIGDVTHTNASGVGQTRYVGFGLGLTVHVTRRMGINLALGTAPLAQSNAATPSLALGVDFR